MQGTNHLPAAPRETSGRAGAIALALALGLGLAACQAKSPEADTAVAPAAAAPATASPPATAEPARAAPATTAADADDQDMPPQRPDDSYNKATLRPQYATCVKSSGGETPALQACGDDELAWQEQRLEQAFMRIVDGPDSKDKDRLMDEQAAYMSDTNRYCSWNPAEDGQGQMLDAQSCRINRTANRADVLQALTSK
ncbi:DUF1311 domain-containing protein [Stenotrophomonas maltophilia]|nr:DUF1311 domain-containing protein [Stenotrophomonas maltophilia]